MTSETPLSRTRLAELIPPDQGAVSVETLGRYLHIMSNVGLSEVVSYQQGVGKLYVGSIPTTIGPGDISALRPWLKTLPQHVAGIVASRIAHFVINAAAPP
ncbi:hypothetical protein [Saccharopolyspora sp. NPDC002686]|uniref:hypothetical protein n=1 Tax=Saccharopolyspora sp. NPDC002686 TaxID=3154541 RepID=UPI00332B3815